MIFESFTDFIMIVKSSVKHFFSVIEEMWHHFRSLTLCNIEEGRNNPYIRDSYQSEHLSCGPRTFGSRLIVGSN